MPGCNPSAWFWGLIPTMLVALIVVAGEGPKIERDLTKRAMESLQQEGYGWATIAFSGREAILTGSALGESERSDAVTLVSRIPGVDSVQDRAKLLPGVSPYTWWATREEGTIKIKGHVPSEADKQTILGIVKATMPDLTIDDRMKLASGAPAKQRWLGAISFALNQLGPLKKGSARLSGMVLDVTGEASTEQAYHAAKNALGGQLPDGLTIDQAAILPPSAKPYSWALSYHHGRVVMAGHIPSDALRIRLLNSIQKAFAGVVIKDGMLLGSGEPEGWQRLLQVVVEQLSRLDEGEVTVQDDAVTLTGLAKDEATATDVVRTFRGALPAPFKSEEKVGARKPQDSEGAPKARPGGKAEKTMARPPRSDNATIPAPGTPDGGASGFARDRDARAVPDSRS